jgi:hypothetical protein
MCTLIVDNVPVEGVSGASHAPVGTGSVSGTVAYPPIVLANGDRAYASVHRIDLHSCIQEDGAPTWQFVRSEVRRRD